jgi:hypothetical protein
VLHSLPSPAIPRKDELNGAGPRRLVPPQRLFQQVMDRDLRSIVRPYFRQLLAEQGLFKLDLQYDAELSVWDVHDH